MALQDRDYLALTLIGEARGEPIEGIVGVANCIRNRVYASNKLYKTVVMAPLQFSCWNQDDPNFAILAKVMAEMDFGNFTTDLYYRQAIAVAYSVYNGDFRDNVFGAKNYVTIQRYGLANLRREKSDEWILKMKSKVTLGKHIFLVD